MSILDNPYYLSAMVGIGQGFTILVIGLAGAAVALKAEKLIMATLRRVGLVKPKPQAAPAKMSPELQEAWRKIAEHDSEIKRLLSGRTVLLDKDQGVLFDAETA